MSYIIILTFILFGDCSDACHYLATRYVGHPNPYYEMVREECRFTCRAFKQNPRDETGIRRLTAIIEQAR
jgi:hypothetical protein